MKRYFLFLLTIFIISNSTAFASTKLFSMNIHCMKDNWKQRVALILDEAISKDSDFINLQEICTHKKESMNNFILSYLTAKTGTIWHANLHYMHLAWDKYDEYIGLYTKHRPDNIDSGFLPRSPLTRAYTAIELNGVWFVGVHLEHSNEWGHYREKQIQFLLQKFKNKKVVLMGDFNSGFNWPEQRQLVASNWKSYFPGLSYPSHKPYKGIDGFWVSPSLKVNINQVQMVLNQPRIINNTSMFLSDHFGVFMEFQEY